MKHSLSLEHAVQMIYKGETYFYFILLLLSSLEKPNISLVKSISQLYHAAIALGQLLLFG